MMIDYVYGFLAVVLLAVVVCMCLGLCAVLIYSSVKLLLLLRRRSS